MQTPLDLSEGIRVLIFTILLSGSILPTFTLAACADYETRVNQAVHSKDLNTLEQLLPVLNEQFDCLPFYLDGVKRSMAQLVAAKANDLVIEGELTEAEAWLKRAPVTLWSTQVIYGDIAKNREQWQKASEFYRQALSLSKESQPASPKKVIEKISQLVSETQNKADNLDTTEKRGVSRGVSR